MFAELQSKTHYTFLDGVSSPAELVRHAAKLGYEAIAITDICSYAGLVKAYQASKECGIKLIVGSQFTISIDNMSVQLILLAPTNAAYSEISALITKGRCRSSKGNYHLELEDLKFGLQHCLAIWLPNRQIINDVLPNAYCPDVVKSLCGFFKQRLWIGVGLFRCSDDQAFYLFCQQLSAIYQLKLVACNDVHMHCKTRKPLLDTAHAIRLGTTVQKLSGHRQINAERYLKPLNVLKSQYPKALLDESISIANQCRFSMDELKYQYPKELVPPSLTATSYLSSLVQQGAQKRWPQGTPQKVQKQINRELSIIAELEYEYYFLTVYDIVFFARSQNILCQGRGSAANSSVCYCLYITEVDPAKHRLLFERFISKERNEPPDIDVDFESQRREEVIQYIYKKYTRKRTALTATVVTYRRKSAVREVAKALGLPVNFADELNRSLAWWDKTEMLAEKLQDRKLNIGSQLINAFLKLVKQIEGTPRHLSQHVGGFLITHSPISTLVPIENAAMPERTVIQWDKYDIEILGLLKIDILGLGMLTSIRRSLDIISNHQGRKFELQDITQEDPRVYDLLCAGDSVGLFQVESRAQMSMLPRLKPRKFYDLVIEVAIVRPGPIQGGMVHPYLRRRDGEEAVDYPNNDIKQVLERTLGVPIFQEQVIELTMIAGGFSGGEADQLRRAMGTFNRNGDIYKFRDKLRSGMLLKGYSEDYANRLFKQIEGFGSYGFPESHSASFALLVYVSAWLKLYHPAIFYVSLLNSQPMGFYSPAQLIQDAKRHQITVLPVCIINSQWQHELELVDQKWAIRLGFCLVKGISKVSGGKIESARQLKAFTTIADIKNRQLMTLREFEKLVNANALKCFDQNRRQAYWQSLPVTYGLPTQTINSKAGIREANIKALSPIETVLSDYQHVRGVSLAYHPMQLVRKHPPFTQCTLANDLLGKRNNSQVQVAGVVTGRQRPGTASGVIFLTLEDETGNINIVLWNNVQERFRDAIIGANILFIKGKLEHKHGVANIIAGYVEDKSSAIEQLQAHSRRFGYK
jgi:error-prone DNA polymerase